MPSASSAAFLSASSELSLETERDNSTGSSIGDCTWGWLPQDQWLPIWRGSDVKSRHCFRERQAARLGSSQQVVPGRPAGGHKGEGAEAAFFGFFGAQNAGMVSSVHTASAEQMKRRTSTKTGNSWKAVDLDQVAGNEGSVAIVLGNSRFQK